MKTLTLELDDDLADKLSRLSKEKRDMLLKIWIERVSSTRSLSDLLDFTSKQAATQGITEEKLEELLRQL